jgi:hypothetical protein
MAFLIMLHRETAILNFPLLVSTSILPSFSTAPLSSPTPKSWGSRWNFFAVLCRSGDTGTSGYGADILNFSFPVSTLGLKSLSDSAIDFSDPDNIRVVSKMYFVT